MKEYSKNSEKHLPSNINSETERFTKEQMNSKRVEENVDGNRFQGTQELIEEIKRLTARNCELQNDNKILKQSQKDMENEIKIQNLELAKCKTTRKKTKKKIRELKNLHAKHIKRLQTKYEEVMEQAEEERSDQMDEITKKYEEQIEFMKIDIDDLIFALEERDTQISKMMFEQGNDHQLERQVNTMKIELERKNAQMLQITGVAKKSRSVILQVEEESQKVLQENKLLKKQISDNDINREFDHSSYNTGIGKFLLPDKFKIIK